MRQYRFQVSEHDPARPWIVVGEIQYQTVSLEDEVNFYDWSSQRWPSPRYKVELRPWSGSPGAWPLVREQR
jgi:hypothetical protein